MNVVNVGLMASAWRKARIGQGGITIDGSAHLAGAGVGYLFYKWMSANWQGPSSRHFM